MTRKVAIYARVSTAEQNPEAQLSELREYAGRRGFEIYREYVDQVTGNIEKRSRDRKRRDVAYQSLMDDAQMRRFDCVLVWKYDRMARSLGALVNALKAFDALGIDFISCTQNIDTTSPMGRFFFHVIGSFAEFERELIVERVRAGLKNAQAKGKILGRPRDRALDERVLILRDQGLSLRAIAVIVERSPAGVGRILKRDVLGEIKLRTSGHVQAGKTEQ
jgi:DNA invertase Pin-like site-specific DNA recombinase